MKRNILATIAVFAVSICPRYAWAQAAVGAEPQAADDRTDGAVAVNHLQPIVPTLTLSAKSDGAARLKVGVDIARPIGSGRWTLQLSPSYEVATMDGVGSLFAVRSTPNPATGQTTTFNESKPWRLGLQVSFSRLGSFSKEEEAVFAQEDLRNLQLRMEAIAWCAAECDDKNDSKFCKRWRDTAPKEQRDAVTALAGEVDVLDRLTRRIAAGAPFVPSRDAFVRSASVYIAAGRAVARGAGAAEANAGEKQDALDAAKKVFSSDVAHGSQGPDGARWASVTTLLGEFDAAETETRNRIYTVLRLGIPPDYRLQWTDVCEDAPQRYILSLDRDRLLQFPEHQVSVGGTAGRSNFKFVEAVSGQPGAFQDGATVTKTGGSMAAVYTHVHPTSNITFELPVVYDSAWNASDKTVRWCTPVGTIIRDPSNPGAGSDAAESCQAKTLNGPSRTRSWTVDALLGYLGAVEKPYWRLSGGFTYSRTSDSVTTKTAYGFVAPIYISFANLDGAPTGVYKGVLRIAPSLVWTTDGSKKGYEASVVVSVLGERSLFGRALDW